MDESCLRFDECAEKFILHIYNMWFERYTCILSHMHTHIEKIHVDYYTCTHILKRYTHIHSYTDADTDTDTDTYTDTDAETDADTDTHRHAQTHRHRHRLRHRQGHRQSSLQTHTH